MNTEASDGLVIFLHGVGGSGRDMLGLAEGWRPSLGGVSFAAPDGPLGFDRGPGRQWFSISGVTDENRPGRIAAARDAFDVTVRTELARHGFADRLDRVVLAGFSQGAMLALDAVMSGRWPVAGAISFSGRLASPTPLHPSLSTKVLLLGGSADAIVPPVETERAAELMRSMGMDVRRHVFQGLGHSVSAEEADLARDFAVTVLKPDRDA